MISCREFVDFLMQYLDEELSPETRASFESHLGDCPPCEVYLDQYRETVALGRKVCEDLDGPVPGDVPERLIEAILAARPRNE